MNTSRESAKEKKIEDPENQNDVLDELTDEDNAQMELPAKVGDANLNDIFDSLESKETQFKELTANYIDFKEFEKGEERAYVCKGKTCFTTKDGEQKPAVSLIDRNGTTWICASTVVVNSLDKVESFPVGCKIKVNGKVKSAKGEYWSVQVFVM